MTSIPHKYQNLYIDQVEKNFLVCNPLAKKNLTILNKEAFFIFSLIDDKKSLPQLFKLVKKKDPSATQKSLKLILKSFAEANLIYFNKPTLPAIKQAKPTHLGVWLHLTNQCNLRCSYCYVHKTSAKMNKMVAHQAIEKIFQTAFKHNFKKITFKFAGGEPLLELNALLEIVNHARNLNQNRLNLNFVVITNGVLLSEKTCQILKDKQIKIAISLDGLKEYHDKTRIFSNGLGTFTEVEKGLNRILKYQIPLNISITVTNRNIKNIPQLTKYLLKKEIPFSFNFYRENPFVSEFLTNDDQQLITYLKKAYKIIEDHPPKHSLINGLLDRVNFSKPHSLACGIGYNYLVIRHDGKLLSCQTKQNKVIGSIDDDDLITSMKKGNPIRPRGLTVEKKEKCQTCQWKYFCAGGCPLLTMDQKGSYIAPSPYCLVYKTLIPEILKLEAKRLIKKSR